MVSAIKYWLTAAQIAEQTPEKFLQTSSLGDLIFSSSAFGGSGGFDPYLEDDATLWLIHWLIASNPKDATTFFWFFNRFYKPEFSSLELLGALKDFVKEQVKTKASESTLKHDVAVLLRMYAPSDESKGPVEEKLDSPLSTLGLLHKNADGKMYSSQVRERRRLPVAAFGYAVMEYLEQANATQLPIEELLRSSGVFAAPGSVFRLSEEGLVSKLEELIRWMPGVLELRDTAGIHQLYRIGSGDKVDVLRKHYGCQAMELAA
jgi:hypothetical protein